MKIITIPYSCDNYAYLLICEQSGEAAVVDPGESYPVMREALGRGVALRRVFCTHHHADHVSGLVELLEEFPGLEVYGHVGDRGRIPGLTHGLDHGATVSVGSHRGRILATPGHTRGSICYRFEGAVFTGDTLFGCGCGRLFEGSAQDMFVSLNETLKGLPADTELYFGHEYTEQNLKFANFVEPGNVKLQERILDTAELRGQNKATTPSTVSLELATNPFLRCSREEIFRNLRERDPDLTAEPLQVFTALRTLKDNF
jgi:hydroxyacylglutathione hydrolase